ERRVAISKVFRDRILGRKDADRQKGKKVAAGLGVHCLYKLGSVTPPIAHCFTVGPNESPTIGQGCVHSGPCNAGTPKRNARFERDTATPWNVRSARADVALPARQCRRAAFRC